MDIGYARVSTQDQNLDLQNDALKSAGCDKIYTDKMSGAKTNRPGLEEILGFIRKGTPWLSGNWIDLVDP